MYATFALWIAVAILALAFACSGLWQALNKRAVKPALVSGSAWRFGISTLIFAGLCAARGIGTLLL